MSTQAPLPFVVRKSDRKIRGKKNPRLDDIISSTLNEDPSDGQDSSQRSPRTRNKPALRRASTRRTTSKVDASKLEISVSSKPSTPCKRTTVGKSSTPCKTTASKPSTPCKPDHKSSTKSAPKSATKSSRQYDNKAGECREQTLRHDSFREPLSPLKLEHDGNVNRFHGVRISSKSKSLSSTSSSSTSSSATSPQSPVVDDSHSGHTELTSPIRRLTFSDQPRPRRRPVTSSAASIDTVSQPDCQRSPTRRSKRAQSPPLPTASTTLSSPPKSPRKAIRETTPPRHRVTNDNNKPRQSCVVAISSPPRSPRKPARDYGVCYQRAKQCLHTTHPERGIVGRSEERAALERFLCERLRGNRPGSLYVSGPPGTGKTALLTDIMKEYTDYKVITANCMTLHRAEHIYNKLLCDLCSSRMSTLNQAGPAHSSSGDHQHHRSDNFKPLPVRQAMIQLQKRLTSSGKPILMVLDEIDQLDTKTQEVLYTLFEWPAINNSRLVLIGIANALDLTDRVLPRLQSRPHCLPELLQFAPYTRQQLAAIIEDRLVEASVDGECVMEPASIQFAARKVAALAGDVRKALDICRAAVESVQTASRSIKAQPPPSLVPSSPRKQVPPQKKRVGLSDVVKVINKSSQNAVTANKSNESTFPLQQKLILCTLVLLMRSQVSGKRQQILVGAYHTAYCKISNKRHVPPVDQSEFISLLDLIESRGIITVKKSSNVRASKVTLNLEESDLQHALSDNKLMTSILSEGLVK